MHRQSTYKAEYDEQVTEWLAEGKTFYSFGQTIGVSTSTLYYWQNDYPSFSHAIKKGREIANKIYSEQFLFDRLENQRMNNVVAILYCRNVLGIKTKDDTPPPPPPPDQFNYKDAIADDD
jgi:hypothetical protein